MRALNSYIREVSEGIDHEQEGTKFFPSPVIPAVVGRIRKNTDVVSLKMRILFSRESILPKKRRRFTAGRQIINHTHAILPGTLKGWW